MSTVPMTNRCPAPTPAPTDAATRLLFRSVRVQRALTNIIVHSLDDGQLLAFCCQLRLLEDAVPQRFEVPDHVEAARLEGWACIGRGAGAMAAAVEGALPLNLRDDAAAGEAVGEIAAVESRSGDLWALLLWRREGEDDETWAARVRAGLLTRRVPVELAEGVLGVEA